MCALVNSRQSAIHVPVGRRLTSTPLQLVARAGHAVRVVISLAAAYSGGKRGKSRPYETIDAHYSLVASSRSIVHRPGDNSGSCYSIKSSPRNSRPAFGLGADSGGSISRWAHSHQSLRSPIKSRNLPDGPRQSAGAAFEECHHERGTIDSLLIK